MRKVKKIIKSAAVLLFWLFIWQIISIIISNDLLFPSPLRVFERLFELLREINFYITVLTSLLRIAAGVVSALTAGVLLAVLSSAVPFVHDLLSPFMSVLKSTPVASFIFLLLLWIGRDVMPAVIAAVILLPVVWTNMETGIKQTDRNLLELAAAYKMKTTAKVRYIYLPSVMPYFVSALKSSTGIAWKAGIAAEVIALPVVSIGKYIFESKLYLQTTELFAWTVATIVISAAIEKLLVFATDKLSDGITGKYRKKGTMDINDRIC